MITANTEKPKALISKSAFIRGLQCVKSLYLDKKRPFLRGKIPELQKAKFKRGHEIGKLAHNLFPGGINAAPKSPKQFKLAVEKTAEYINEGRNVIYEAAFSENGINILLDILVKEKNGWKAIEVKSSKAISETYLWDASLQYFVIAKTGLNISDFQMCYIDENYVRKGEIDVHKFFKLESIIDEIEKKLPLIPEKIESFYETINLTSSPGIKIGRHCNYPYPCDFIKHCWKKVPEFSILSVFGIEDKKRFELFHSGIELLDLLNEKEISDISKKHIEVIQDKSYYLNKKATLLTANKAKIIFYKSISVDPALPYYQQSSPFEKTGIGFSVLNNENINLTFIEETKKDPSYNYLTNILKLTNNAEKIIVFDKNLETEILLNHQRRSKEISINIKEITDKMICLKSMFFGGNLLWPGMMKNGNPAEILENFGVTHEASKTKITSDLQAAQLYMTHLSGQISVEEAQMATILTDYLQDETKRLRSLYNLVIAISK